MVDTTALGVGRLVLGIADSLGKHELTRTSLENQIAVLQQELEQRDKRIAGLESEIRGLREKKGGKPTV